jgi:hypothetical protein
MDVPRPQALGDQSVVKQLRSILFSESILGAASVRPKGSMKLFAAPLLGWLGPLLARRVTDPLPPTELYLAATSVDIRIFSKPVLADPFEIGRWKNHTYRASIRVTFLSLNLDLELERLGRVRLVAGPRVFAGSARPVFELVVQNAAGPAM